MKQPKHNDPIDILGSVYEKLFEHVVSNIKSLQNMTLAELLQQSQNEVSEISELSQEEADKVSDWLHRDILAISDYVRTSEHEFEDWLGFETALIESSMLYLLSSIADKTTVELLQLKEQATASPYKSGEYTGPGILVCDQCGEELHFHKVSKIPPCPRCHATVFHRKLS